MSAHPPTAEPVVLRISGAARRLDISESSVRRLITQGALPHVRIGGVVRVPVAAIDELVERSFARVVA